MRGDSLPLQPTIAPTRVVIRQERVCCRDGRGETVGWLRSVVTGARVEHDDVCFAAREQLVEDGQVADHDRQKCETSARLEYSDRLSQLGHRRETGGPESEKSITTEEEIGAKTDRLCAKTE